jgi:hypothetical protein
MRLFFFSLCSDDRSLSRAHQLWWIFSLLANLPLVLHIARLPRDASRTSIIAQVALVNLTITVLVRNELILAASYWLASMIPFRRFYPHRMLHSVGGLHVGCAFATFM